MKPKKPKHKKAIRTNITIAPTIWEAFETRIRPRGFDGLSDYLRDRIRIDAGLDKPQAYT